MKLKNLFFLLIVSLSFCVKARLDSIQNRSKADPIEASRLLQARDDSDDKFILLYKIDKLICERAHFSSKFGKEDQKKHGNYIKKYENSNNSSNYRFRYYEPGGSYNPTRYWLNKLKNKHHNLLAEFDLHSIRGFVDGCPDIDEGKVKELSKKYNKWLKDFPNHSKVENVKLIIRNLRPKKGCM